MSRIIHDTLEEIGNGSIEVEIGYDYYPGEPLVQYHSDGSGSPGCLSFAELIGVHVRRWDVNGDERPRGESWVWNALDEIAFDVVERDWERFEESCLEDAN